MTTSALILFAHGARDPRWAAPFQRLQEIIRAQQPGLEVHLAFLELMTPRLPEVAADLAARGCAEATVVPVFFGQGGHVLRDLPVLVEELRAAHPGMAVKVAPAVGEDAEVLGAIAKYCLSRV
ncbi:sirohydrochlorin chelatase [Noviherbaspirillum galbum]|uniref:Cobalamin biosynthesis protein CbiX n=1 Tax=Noviherbaspirillum galbum TaxID=2709383 RepID=A0A6B3SMV6_9BURK|nr:CbiX/SirB N-terminal domain-containing protein [Noviherbaspirillum galbum]NEX62063.1 cobalamin biosynthesis protein CbiX [Noviherbaspirillum galbum]